MFGRGSRTLDAVGLFYFRLLERCRSEAENSDLANSTRPFRSIPPYPKQKARTSRQQTLHVQVQREGVLERPVCVSQLLCYSTSPLVDLMFNVYGLSPAPHPPLCPAGSLHYGRTDRPWPSLKLPDPAVHHAWPPPLITSCCGVIHMFVGSSFRILPMSLHTSFSAFVAKTKSVAANLDFVPESCHQIVIRLETRSIPISSIHKYWKPQADSPLLFVQSKKSVIGVTTRLQR